MKNLPNFVKGILSCFAVIAGLFLLAAFIPPSKSGQLAKQRALEARVSSDTLHFSNLSPDAQKALKDAFSVAIIDGHAVPKPVSTWSPPKTSEEYIAMLNFILVNSYYNVTTKTLMLEDKALGKDFFMRYDGIGDIDGETYHFKLQ